MKTMIMRKQYVKPATKVFEMQTQKPVLFPTSGDPDYYNILGGELQF